MNSVCVCCKEVLTYRRRDLMCDECRAGVPVANRAAQAPAHTTTNYVHVLSQQEQKLTRLRADLAACRERLALLEAVAEAAKRVRGWCPVQGRCVSGDGYGTLEACEKCRALGTALAALAPKEGT